MFKYIFAILTVMLVGCASTPYDRASASHVVRVVEGEVVNVRVEKPGATATGPSVKDTAVTAVAANNVGNTSVMKGLLVLDILSDLADDTPKVKKYHRPTEVYTIKDKKSGDVIELDQDTLYAFGENKADVGDRVRALHTKAKRWALYNLTKNPELDEKTR